MSGYRKEISAAEREARWTFFKFLPLLVLVLVVLSGLGFALRSFGLIGKTVVEREVFENSYQRQASLQAQLAIDEATLIEIEGKLANPLLDEGARINLEAQKSAIKVRIASTKEMQK